MNDETKVCRDAVAGPVEPTVRPLRRRKTESGLTRTQLHQLLDYAQHCENEGWYWGNAAQFRKRHNKLKAWLNAQIDAAA